MKLLLFSIVFTALGLGQAFSQCNYNSFMGKCAEHFDDFTYVRTFNKDGTEDTNKTEYSMIFNKDHEYLIVICYDTNLSDKRMIVDLLDRNKEKIQSSYYEPLDMHVQKILFKCNATGVYFLETYFEDFSESCGAVVLGCKKIE
jgi:hypothetical protein